MVGAGGWLVHAVGWRRGCSDSVRLFGELLAVSLGWRLIAVHRSPDRTSEDHGHTVSLILRLTWENASCPQVRRVTTGCCIRRSAAGRGEVEELGWFAQVKGAEDGLVAGVAADRWATRPSLVARVTRCIRSSS